MTEEFKKEMAELCKKHRVVEYLSNKDVVTEEFRKKFVENLVNSWEKAKLAIDISKL